ncbi:MAG: gamma-glutamyltransferase [Rhodospirillales bacterium]|nr:gamma-glutamyltransferase [Rhodospirillales bacterium]
MTGAGAIAAGHPETAGAAAAVLRDGGNAFDAALAAMCVACVAEPVLASLGGGGFFIARPAGGAPVLYDFFPQTPMVARSQEDIDFFPILADFGPAQQEFHIGMGSMATPGMVRGLSRIQKDLGSMALHRIVEPAAELARNGVEVNSLQAYVLGVVEVIYTRNADCLRAYGSTQAPGKPAQAGETLSFPELADTFEALAREGDDLFYRGDIAKALVADSIARGGLLTAGDLEAYRVEVRQPLATVFAGAKVFTNPPPSVGGILIAFGLELLKNGAVEGLEFGSPQYLERLARVMAGTQKARIEGRLHEMAPETAETQFLRPDFIDAYRRDVLGRRTATRGTTHISVIDAAGNAAGVTVTNGEGAAYIIPGTGVMMNNMLGEEDINPHGFHSWPKNARLSSMMAPSLIEHEDGWTQVMGSGGSNRIRTAMLQVLVNQLAFGMEPDRAVKAPRIHVEGDLVSVETGFEMEAVTALTNICPRVERWDAINFFFGGAHSVRFDPHEGIFDGVGDPRRGGVFQIA